MSAQTVGELGEDVVAEVGRAEPVARVESRVAHRQPALGDRIGRVDHRSKDRDGRARIKQDRR